MTNTQDETGAWSVVDNVKLGLIMGLGVAGCFAALSTISGIAGLSLGRPSANPFVSLHMTYLVGLECHLVAGVVGGLLGGLMRPLARWLVGTMLIGWVVGATTWIVFSIGEYGRDFWNTDTKMIAAAFAIIGAIIAPYFRYKVRSGMRIGAKKTFLQ